MPVMNKRDDDENYRMNTEKDGGISDLPYLLRELFRVTQNQALVTTEP